MWQPAARVDRTKLEHTIDILYKCLLSKITSVKTHFTRQHQKWKQKNNVPHKLYKTDHYDYIKKQPGNQIYKQPSLIYIFINKKRTRC